MTEREGAHGQHRTRQLIIDNRAEGVFRVHRRAFTDPHLLELEKCRVFDQSWLYAGHASEIPQPGDFRARRVWPAGHSRTRR